MFHSKLSSLNGRGLKIPREIISHTFAYKIPVTLYLFLNNLQLIGLLISLEHWKVNSWGFFVSFFKGRIQMITEIMYFKMQVK